MRGNIYIYNLKQKVSILFQPLAKKGDPKAEADVKAEMEKEAEAADDRDKGSSLRVEPEGGAA